MRISDVSKKITIEWAKDALPICVEKKRFCEWVKLLAETNPQGYVYCKNKFNVTNYGENVEYCGVTSDKKWHCAKINWTIDESNNEFCAYLRTKKGLFRIYTPQFKSTQTVGGYKGVRQLSAEIKKELNCTLYKLAGTIDGVKNPDAMHFFKYCQYRQIIFCDTASTGKILTNFNKIDRSSAYPAEGATFPDFKTLEFFDTEKEFFESKKKFAFFENSGRVIEKGIFDSKKILAHHYYGDIYKNEKEKHGGSDGRIWAFDETANISRVWQLMFEKRKIDDTVKSAMVSSIGFMQSEKYAKKTYFGHCSAIIYLRHVKKMLDKIDEIERAGGKPVLIATDAIAWIGGDLGKIKFNTGEKQMGEFQLETKNAIACIKCNGVYAWKDEKGLICKHQGVKGEVKIKNIMDVLKLEPEVAVFNLETVNGIILPNLKKIKINDENLMMIDSEGY